MSSLKQLLVIACIIAKTVVYSQSLSEDAVTQEVKKMMGSGIFDASIVRISEPHNTFQIAHVNLPYRDFPNIIIFKWDASSKQWKRVLEGLNPGIQDAPSGYFDWHTKGRGVDFTFGESTQIVFDDKKFRTMQDAVISRKSILIPYQHFMHMQTMDSVGTYSPYTIDKTHYYDFAIQLFGDLFTGYSNDQCMMFDSPKITDVNLSFENGMYFIQAKTNNGQRWVYSFTDVDGDYKYLLNKNIKVYKD